jgi:o-succinylbenzoate synthase
MNELDSRHYSENWDALTTTLQTRIVYLQLPLIVPYRLAFGEQQRFDVILVGLRSADNRVGWGEATILPGYTTETVEEGWSVALALMQKCRTSADVRQKALAAAKSSPFIASAFLTALDCLENYSCLSRAGQFPLLGTVNGKFEAFAALEQEIETLISIGYRTLKLKVGWDVEKDIKQVSTVQKIVAGRAQLRVDGNQGYTLEQALEFLSLLDPTDIELLEQPCAAGDWNAAVAVKQAAGIPIMLDESIYTLEDVSRAATLGCADFVKLKLMKLGSLETLERGLRMITNLGMTPVLGNGVATDLGCWMELTAALGNVPTAGEMNGFLKIRPQLLSSPLRMEGAEVILDGERPKINEAVIAEYAVRKAGQWQ